MSKEQPSPRTIVSAEDSDKKGFVFFNCDISGIKPLIITNKGKDKAEVEKNNSRNSLVAGSVLIGAEELPR